MKPLLFSNTLAHPNDPLPIHLERVAQRAAASIAPSARREAHLIAFLAGLFHDIGKATPFFQAYLAGKAKKGLLSSHAKSGAVLAWWYGAELELPLWLRLGVFIAVLRHHGALKFDSWKQALVTVQGDLREGDETLQRQLAAMDLTDIHCWLGEVAERNPEYRLPVAPTVLSLESVIERLLDRRSAGQSKLRRAFQDLDEALGFVAGFGGLLAVDKIDAATQGGAIVRQALPRDAVTVYKVRTFGDKPGSGLNDRRARIAETVLNTWLTNLQAPLLTLTAPTGTGKTLAVLHAALVVRDELCAAGDPAPRIIYCLPFTSVIDQNHRVFRDVLKASGLADREDRLLKHHHLVDGLFRAKNAEYQPDGAGQLLTETWQSEIVVTTFYQLLHTLLSNRNANLKRAGQLTGSLVLMDEVQALPLCYWAGLRSLFQSAARALGARFVLLTATRPLIFRPEDACELLPDHDDHFRALNRVRLHCHQHSPVTVLAFADRLGAELKINPRSMLVILNRRRAVRDLFQHLKQAGLPHRLIALSTDLTPRDRRARIRLIQRLLRQQVPCIVVSTQLVEAGVDISFPVVHRSLAPLDAIIQSAGRCNRHAGDEQMGEVHLWDIRLEKPDGELGQALWRRIYDSHLIEVTGEVLGQQAQWNESDFLSLSQRYFEGCWGRQGQVRMDEWLAGGDFIKLEQAFKLIPDGPPTTSLFVVRKPADAVLWQRYEAIHAAPNTSPLEKDKAFRKMRHVFYERVVQVYPPPHPDPEHPVIRLEARDKTYTRETGFVPMENDQEESTCIL